MDTKGLCPPSIYPGDGKALLSFFFCYIFSYFYFYFYFQNRKFEELLIEFNHLGGQPYAQYNMELYAAFGKDESLLKRSLFILSQLVGS
jgi:hypothetical protein